MTSPYGPRVAPLPGASTNHLGEDTVGDGNYWPVSGVIIFAGYYGSWGNIIGIRQEPSPEPDGAEVRWWVAHNDLIPFDAKYGKWGNERDWLAPLGDTGNVTGPHAHTERRVGGTDQPGTGTPTNPRLYYTGAASSSAAPQGDDDMTYALKLVSDPGTHLPGVPKGAVFIGSGTDPLVWVSNSGPEAVNGVAHAEWDAKSIAERIAQVGLRGSGTDLNRVYKSMADARDRKNPVYTLGAATGGSGGDNTAVVSALEAVADALTKVPTAQQNGQAARDAIVKK